MRALYSVSVHVYQLLIRLAALFTPKAKLWVKGRRNWLEHLRESLKKIPPGSEVVWFHCASLGEFEQGRPLIEKYRSLHPSSKILLTFFSPSGYEIRKNYAGADIICYLPADTSANARNFIDAIRPKLVFFVKYEFWFNYLDVLKKRNVPAYLVSGIFRKEQHFFKPYGSWSRKQLASFRYFFLQDETSAELLQDIGYKNTLITGDTRFDRVAEIARNVGEFDLVRNFTAGGNVVILGSSWREDESLISKAAMKDYRLIIAPHEINEHHLASVEETFRERICLRYSKADATNIQNADILIIDNIGMLSSLYQYASIAFIGGGFGKGIHNILEASAFGLPVIFGPDYGKFKEAKDLVKLGGAFSVANVDELNKTLRLLKNDEVFKTAAHISRHYVESRTGAADKILKAIS